MPEVEETRCPHCGVIGRGIVEIDKLFGFRTWQDKTFPQSYCRRCRKIR